MGCGWVGWWWGRRRGAVEGWANHLKDCHWIARPSKARRLRPTQAAQTNASPTNASPMCAAGRLALAPAPLRLSPGNRAYGALPAQQLALGSGCLQLQLPNQQFSPKHAPLHFCKAQEYGAAHRGPCR